MRKYFWLQMKRAVKLFPFVLAVTVTLLIGLGIVLTGVVSMLDSSEESTRYTIALSGDTDDAYVQWGLTALQSIDAERFSIEIVEMPEAAAQRALEKGEISAYVLLPEGFMEKAVTGEIEPVTYVTSAGMESIATMLKKEITTLVTEMVVYSQKGAYALADVIRDNMAGVDEYSHMTNLSLQYTQMIFHRDRLYTVEELGISDGLSTRDYYICAASVIMLVLMGIPFAILYVRRDYALPRLLHSRGFGTMGQLVCEYGVHLGCMAMLTAVVLLTVSGAAAVMPGIPISSLPDMGSILSRVIPVLVMLSALNMLIFTLSDNLVSGLLLHFFAAIGLCYISGCIYPAYTFPKAMWRLSALLPTGMARSHLATCFTLKSSGDSLAGLMAYAALFFGLTWLLRLGKTGKVRG